MSESEQREHLGQLLVEERQLARTMACLESKLQRIHEALGVVVSARDAHPMVRTAKLPEPLQGASDAGAADLARHLDEYGTTARRLIELRRQIHSIDPAS